MVGVRISIGTWRWLPELSVRCAVDGLYNNILDVMVRAPTSSEDFGQIAAGLTPFVFFYALNWMPTIRRVKPPDKISLEQQQLTLANDADLKKLDIGAFGFLPDHPIRTLEDKYYQPWEALATALPQLNRTRQIHAAILDLPVLSVDRIRDDVPALKRACLLLGQLAHSWINNHAVPWQQQHEQNDIVFTTVPKQIAKPWYEASTKLGLPTVLTASTCDMWNWTKVNEDGAMSPTNLKLISSCTGTSSETYFHTIPCAMNATFGSHQLPLHLFNLPYHIQHTNTVEVKKALIAVRDVVREFKSIFKQAKDLVEVDVFYEIYRPLLGAFHPNGGVLAGADASGADVNVNWKGPSAGQSPMMVMLDCALSVEHKHASSSRSFQQEMVMHYMTSPHRKLLLTLETRAQATKPLSQFATEHGGEIQVLFNECVESLTEFRKYHLAVATKYLKATKTGTGSSTFRDLLKEFVNDTAASKI